MWRLRVNVMLILDKFSTLLHFICKISLDIKPVAEEIAIVTFNF